MVAGAICSGGGDALCLDVSHPARRSFDGPGRAACGGGHRVYGFAAWLSGAQLHAGQLPAVPRDHSGQIGAGHADDDDGVRAGDRGAL